MRTQLGARYRARTIRPRAGFLVPLAVLALLAAGCRDTILSVVEVARVEIQGLPAGGVAVGDTLQLHAAVTGADGKALSGRRVEWASSDTAVVKVSAGGRATAVATGTAVVTATAEGQSASAPLRVGAPPELALASDSVVLRARVGSTTPAVDSVEVTSTGAGQVGGLTATVSYPAGSADGWLSVSVGGPVPTRIMLQASSGSLPTGRHPATVSIRDARGGSLSLPVTLVVQTGIARWSVQEQAPDNRHLNDVWAVSDRDAFAVADDGTLLRFDGSRASTLRSVSGLYYSNPLRGVWGTSASNVWAVGGYGTVLRFDGARWVQYDAGTIQTLNAVWGPGAGSAYAVGSASTIVRFDGVRWQPARTGSYPAPALHGVGGSSDRDVYAVGERGAILRFDGTAWSAVSSGTTRTLRSVWAAAPDNVYAVGDSGTVLHFDGSAWRPVATGATADLRSVRGSSARDVYVAGDEGVLLHFDGSSWRRVESGTRAPLRGLWISQSGGLAVGARATVVRHDGTRWTELQSGPSLHGVWGGGSHSAFAVGEFGIVLRYDGARWHEQESGTARTLRGVWGSSAGNVFAVGDAGTILHYDGSAWRAMESGTRVTLYAVRGTGPGNVYAVGAGGTVLHYDGSGWKTLRSGPYAGPGSAITYTGVWVSPTGEVHAVGWLVGHFFRDMMIASTHVSRFDGTGWTDTTIGSGSAAFDYSPTLGIRGFSAGELFATVYPGSVARFDGSGWTQHAAGTPLRDVWGSSATDVYAVGGGILHFDGSGWSSLGNPARYPLHGVWGSSASEVFVVGEGRTILRGTP